MYTWGCGWHGQTGHGSWNNEYLPKVLKSNYTKDTKFIMASCGSKHTLALDANGQIWYFGNKMSVGIEDL
jgi:alpha-tubulin suppressor-like RCC1 family protein